MNTESTTNPETPTEEPQYREPQPVLQVERVSVEFDGNLVLRDIDFTVFDNESVAIIGESGCGKTVLLKTLIALNTPARGRVLFSRSDLAELSYFDLAETRTRYGYVFQQAALFDSMTVGENIAFSLVEHTDRSREDIYDRVVHLLGEVGLARATLDKKPAELSGGMRKRVGFARALALEPELMLYDEPTTGLDPIMSDVINELMISTRRHHNVTSVMVTHDMKSAFKVADRIIMLYPIGRLRDGESQIIFDGTPKELETSKDRRVWQFLHGVAGERLEEMEN